MINSTDNLVVKSVQQLVEDRLKKDLPITFDFYWKNFKDGKEKTVSAMRMDITRLTKLFESVFYPKRVQGLEDYTLSTIRRAIKLKQEGRENFANVKQPIIRTFVDRLLKGIVKANFSLKTFAVNDENKDKVAAVQAAIDWCFATAKVKSKMMEVASSAILNGNWYAKSSFTTPESKIKNIQNPDAREVVKITKEYASFEWVSEFDLFYEPTEPLRWAQRMVIRRSIKPLKSVLSMIDKMDSHIDKEHLVYLMKNNRAFLTKDYNLVRLMKYYDNVCYSDPKFSIDNTYNVAYNNDKVEYVEIWTPDTLSVCINGYIVADTENPLKDRDRRHPYFDAHYTTSPWVAISEGVGILLWDIQKGYDALFNLLLDQATMTASPMIMLSPWQQMQNNESDTNLKRRPRGFLLNAWPWSVSFLTPPSVDQGTITILQNMLEMAQFNIAPSTYADYNTQSRSAQDSMLRFEGLADTVALFIDSMSRMLNEVAQAWLLDMQKKMPEIFELPIFDNKWVVKGWKKIKRSDLEWAFIFEWASESIRDVNTILEKNQLNEFLSALAAFATDDDGKTLIDKKKMLKYITSLYRVDEDMVLTDEEAAQRKEQLTIENEKLNQKVALIQNETQKYIAQEQQEMQKKPEGDLGAFQQMFS